MYSLCFCMMRIFGYFAAVALASLSHQIHAVTYDHPTQLAGLPDDILRMVADRLEQPRDFAAFTGTQKRMRALTRHSHGIADRLIQEHGDRVFAYCRDAGMDDLSVWRELFNRFPVTQSRANDAIQAVAIRSPESRITEMEELVMEMGKESNTEISQYELLQSRLVGAAAGGRKKMLKAWLGRIHPQRATMHRIIATAVANGHTDVVDMLNPRGLRYKFNKHILRSAPPKIDDEGWHDASFEMGKRGDVSMAARIPACTDCIGAGAATTGQLGALRFALKHCNRYDRWIKIAATNNQLDAIRMIESAIPPTSTIGDVSGSYYDGLQQAAQNGHLEVIQHMLGAMDRASLSTMYQNDFLRAYIFASGPHQQQIRNAIKPLLNHVSTLELQLMDVVLTGDQEEITRELARVQHAQTDVSDSIAVASFLHAVKQSDNLDMIRFSIRTFPAFYVETLNGISGLVYLIAENEQPRLMAQLLRDGIDRPLTENDLRLSHGMMKFRLGGNEALACGFLVDAFMNDPILAHDMWRNSPSKVKAAFDLAIEVAQQERLPVFVNRLFNFRAQFVI